MFFSRFVELASVYGITPEQMMAEVRDVLDPKAPDAEVHDSRHTTELIRLAHAVPRTTLQGILNLLRSIARSASDERTS